MDETALWVYIDVLATKVPRSTSSGLGGIVLHYLPSTWYLVPMYSRSLLSQAPCFAILLVNNDSLSYSFLVSSNGYAVVEFPS
jgi:hypothetical protein